MDKWKQRYSPNSSWDKDGFATRRKNDVQALGADSNKGYIDITDVNQAPPDGVHRIPYDRLSVEDFIRLYETPQRPCIITGIPEKDKWPAAVHWSSWNAFEKAIDDPFDRHFPLRMPMDPVDGYGFVRLLLLS